MYICRVYWGCKGFIVRVCIYVQKYTEGFMGLSKGIYTRRTSFSCTGV